MKLPLRSFLLLSFLLLLFLSSSSSSRAGTAKPAIAGDDQTTSGNHQRSPFQGDESLDKRGKVAVSSEEEEEEEEEGGLGFIEGRMAIQSDDYPGTGANNRHNPKPPTIH